MLLSTRYPYGMYIFPLMPIRQTGLYPLLMLEISSRHVGAERMIRDEINAMLLMYLLNRLNTQLLPSTIDLGAKTQPPINIDDLLFSTYHLIAVTKDQISHCSLPPTAEYSEEDDDFNHGAP